MQIFILFLEKYSVLIFRIMLSLIFIVAGGNHLFATSVVSSPLVNTDPGKWLTTYIPAELLVILAGIGLLLGGLTLLTGYKTRWAALNLLLIIIPITMVIQTQGFHTVGPFFKNVGLMGGLIYFLARGSSTYGLDNIKALKITL